jgi:uncharacterized protein (TIGR02145 family)
MKKHLLIVFVAVCAALFALAFAQEDNAVAVYMAGAEPKGALGAHKMVGGELVKAISRSGKYSAINRTDEILKVIAKEHGYQRSGAVSDDQIKTLGQQLGVQYLCIAEISDVKGGSFYLDVRLVDVVTAKTINSATATSALKNNGEMMAVAQQVARELVGGGTGAAAAAGNTFTDNRDGKVYRKVAIGRQTWMAENLNYAARGSRCYGEGGNVEDDELIETKLSNAEVQVNCTKYGRLYDWSTAKKICPAGWRLPSDGEWEALVNYVGDSAGTKLKSKTGWNDILERSSSNGTDNYGFSALPGGTGNSDGSFGDAVIGGFWWSATKDNDSRVKGRLMRSEFWNVLQFTTNKEPMCSVRCIQDE